MSVLWAEIHFTHKRHFDLGGEAQSNDGPVLFNPSDQGCTTSCKLNKAIVVLHLHLTGQVAATRKCVSALDQSRVTLKWIKLQNQPKSATEVSTY